jgi:hypothetical protein
MGIISPCQDRRDGGEGNAEDEEDQQEAEEQSHHGSGPPPEDAVDRHVHRVQQDEPRPPGIAA